MAGQFVFANVFGDDGRMDVIFVHGLGGDPKETWSNSGATEEDGAFWPLWLKKDIPDSAIYSLGYPASWFAKWIAKEMNLYEQAKQVLETLSAYGLGKRPIVFVCHSLGGLLVKQLIRTALESTDDGWKAIAQNCMAIFFIATPHFGAALANILKGIVRAKGSPHIDALMLGSDELVALNEACRGNCTAAEIEVVAYYEKHALPVLGVVVDRASADPGIGSNAPIAIDANHIEISQPSSRDATLYLSIWRRISRIVDSLPASAQDAFAPDALAESSSVDRRDLHEKLLAGGREHEYPAANDSQSRFAINYSRTGLLSIERRVNDELLADVEERFNAHVYHALICNGAAASDVDQAIQQQVIDPLTSKYGQARATARTIRSAIYFLAGKCHLRWDPA